MDPYVPVVTKRDDDPPKEPQLKDAIEIMPPIMYVGFDSSIPNAESIRQLNDLMAAISTIPGTVELTGHTDAAGNNVYNEHLSERRVRAVQQLMIDSGNAPSKIRIHYKGEFNPVSSNATSTGRALNRRVEIIFVEDL